MLGADQLMHVKFDVILTVNIAFWTVIVLWIQLLVPSHLILCVKGLWASRICTIDRSHVCHSDVNRVVVIRLDV